jgi:isoleucyl-tRNA synthetase
VLRLWVAAEDYSEDIRLSDEILNRVADAYRRIRNTCRFLLGALADFDPERDRVSYGQLEELDRWALLRLGELIARVRRAYDEYQFHVVFHSAHNFCSVDLSALYLDIIKDRLYVSAAKIRGGGRRRRCFEVLTASPGSWPPSDVHRREVWSHIPGGQAESVPGHVPRERASGDERLAASGTPARGARRVSRARAREAGKIGKGHRRSSAW